MPANLTPQYMEAERRFREAASDEDKLAALREMLSVIPKHKGTDKMQGDIKRRIAKFTQAVQQRRRSSGRRVDLFAVERHGAGQVVLLGMPNVGKSSLVAALTNAHTEVADYPFTTHKPAPGMVKFEDVQMQLVDTPPLTPEGGDSGLFTLVRQTDAAAVVVDLGSEDVLEHAQTVLDVLAGRKIQLSPRFEKSEDLSTAVVKAMFIAAKADLDPDGERRVMFQEFFADSLPCTVVSVRTQEGLADLPRALFGFLELIRVYTKQPGKKDKNSDPFVLRKGGTVLDLARAVHQDFVEKLKFARMWGQGVHDGQTVGRDHVLADGDTVELHV